MLSILKNDIMRIKERKRAVIVSWILTICSIGMAIVLPEKMNMKQNLAVIGNHPAIESDEFLNITQLKEEPPISELIQNKYDAVAVYDTNGTCHIKSIKGEKRNAVIQSLLKGDKVESVNTEDERKIGTNIIGYMLMFLMMQGTIFSDVFAEDKEKHLTERVICSPLSFAKYLSGHGLFMSLFIFVPSILTLAAASLFKMKIGFSLEQYTFLFAIVTFMSVAVALCIHAFFIASDTANMIANSVIVLSTILSGSFYDMTSKNGLLSKLMYLLPQKSFLYFADHLEKKSINGLSMYALIYVIIGSIILLGIGVWKTRKDYTYHRS